MKIKIFYLLIMAMTFMIGFTFGSLKFDHRQVISGCAQAGLDGSAEHAYE